MKKNYWTKFWMNYAWKTKDKDVQSQVLRTSNKKPIEPARWKFTLAEIMKQVQIQKNDDILDLCCGNGLIAKELSPQCKSVTAVDIAQNLVDKIDTTKYKNINTIVEDMRKLNFNKNSFSRIIIYAGIQYLDYQETIKLFGSAYQWLRPSGLFFIGDIPDLEKKWVFHNTPKREKAYFDSIKNKAPIVGTWFSKDFLLKLSNYWNFSESKILQQHKEMIYAHFRYDMLIKK